MKIEDDISTGTNESEGDSVEEDPELSDSENEEESSGNELEDPEDKAKSKSNGFKPRKPKFGGLRKTGTDLYTAWTGGKPKADWSELKTTKPKFIQPTQFRPSSIAARAKGQHYRTTGLTTKFGRDGNLQNFQRQVFEHLEDNGLDTITYLKDPGDHKKVISAVTDYGKFNIDKGIKEANDTALLHFDEYDNSNQKDAKKFLCNSLSDDLYAQVYESAYKDDSFLAHWFELIRIVKSGSVEHFNNVKDRMKGRKVSQYAGENVESAASDWLTDYEELHNAGVYDHNLTLSLLTNLMMAGGSGEDFKYKLRVVKDEVETELEEIRYMDYRKAHAHMTQKKLDVRSILKVAMERYRMLLDDNRWPAASHAKDSKAMTRNYGRVNSLVQSQTQDKPKGDCHNCGADDHWKRDCPLLKNKNSIKTTGTSGSRNAPKRGSTKDFKRKNSAPAGLTDPPKSGESEIKFLDGKKRYWCAKCGRWTLSHGVSAIDCTRESSPN